MTADKMTLERLETIIATYGARADRWPAAERPAAEALLAGSAVARALLDEAAVLDRLLDEAPAMAPTPTLRAAILATAPRKSGRSRADRLVEAWRAFRGELGGFRAAGPVLAASLLLGIIAGGTLSENATPEPDADLLQLAVSHETFAE